ncbi:peptidase [Vibrio campbellii ATCC BAA-1116]|uniref:Ig-like domain-containing protein n=1 Tax=Vibrio campbellii TaxID=680 RepID=UPI00039261A7|nr:peptidase [Vibrio campbellii]AGU98528.1 peptidase [Vibrio campbellii ATCC BAA-1116]
MDETIKIEVRDPDLTAGYTLDREVVVMGDGVASGNSETDVITYEANSQGVTRLVYTMTNADGSALLVGTVDVAVSGPGNHAPVATDASFRMESDDIESPQTPQTFDLSAYVSDEDDGDDIQLILVDAWNAQVDLAAPDDTSNLSFTFKPRHAGFHYVTYVVTDNKGGYGVAQVKIEVVDLSAGATWGNIQMGLKLFFGPLTSSEADLQGVTSTSSNFDSNDADVATFNFVRAEDSCQSKGRLPTSDELKALAQYNNGQVISDGWPVDLAYWANNNGTGELIDLKNNGSVVPETNPGGYYVSCMNEAGLVVVDADSRLEAVADDAEQAVVAVKLTLDDMPVEGQLIEASAPDRTNVTFDDTTLYTNDKGVAKFALNTWEAGQVPVNIKYDGETLLTQNVTFVADEATARLVLEVTKNNAPYDDSTGNEVEATMVDDNNNPLVGRPVTFTSPEEQSVTINKGSEVTDATGKQNASVVWKDSSTTDASTTVTVTGSYTPQSTGTQISETAEITFISPEPLKTCGEINDTNKSNAAGNCLKIATGALGYWFTSTPSIEVMNQLGYSINEESNNTGDTYAASYVETGVLGPDGGEFALFMQNGDGVSLPGVNGQFDRWCQKLNVLRFGGRSTWERPTMYELNSLYSAHGNLWTTRGWPTWGVYWSSDVIGKGYNALHFYSGVPSTTIPGAWNSASCVSKHP